MTITSEKGKRDIIDREYKFALRSGKRVSINCFDFNLAVATKSNFVQAECGLWIFIPALSGVSHGL